RPSGVLCLGGVARPAARRAGAGMGIPYWPGARARAVCLRYAQRPDVVSGGGAVLRATDYLIPPRRGICVKGWFVALAAVLCLAVSMASPGRVAAQGITAGDTIADIDVEGNQRI